MYCNAIKMVTTTTPPVPFPCGPAECTTAERSVRVVHIYDIACLAPYRCSLGMCPTSAELVVVANVHVSPHHVFLLIAIEIRPLVKLMIICVHVRRCRPILAFRFRFAFRSTFLAARSNRLPPLLGRLVILRRVRLVAPAFFALGRSLFLFPSSTALADLADFRKRRELDARRVLAVIQSLLIPETGQAACTAAEDNVC